MGKKICIQAGHQGITIGATGAPNEREWNTETVKQLSEILIKKGFEVYTCGALADTDPKVTNTDWDLFLAVHYDADMYNDRGGFIDTPDASVDASTTESNRIAKILKVNYFTKELGIPEKPARSNANTKFYYMWSSLTAKTPCVLIECGVGNRSPEDKNTLFNRRIEVINALVKGICESFGIPSDPVTITKCEDVDIPSEIETKYKLKDFPRYNNHWTYENLVKDWTVLCKNIDVVNKNLTESQNNYDNLITSNSKLIEDYNQAIVDLEKAITLSSSKDKKITELTNSLATSITKERYTTEYNNLKQKYTSKITEVENIKKDEVIKKLTKAELIKILLGLYKKECYE